jgi:hypothetical protein
MLIVVLFNLKPGASREDYENWARSTDIPNVNALSSVSSFSVLRTTGLLGSDAAAPYEYVELLDVGDMAQLGSDISTETMQRIAAEFQDFADGPAFMLTEPL